MYCWLMSVLHSTIVQFTSAARNHEILGPEKNFKKSSHPFCLFNCYLKQMPSFSLLYSELNSSFPLVFPHRPYFWTSDLSFSFFFPRLCIDLRVYWSVVPRTRHNSPSKAIVLNKTLNRVEGLLHISFQSYSFLYILLYIFWGICLFHNSMTLLTCVHFVTPSQPLIYFFL